jgi:hypothetical protein
MNIEMRRLIADNRTARWMNARWINACWINACRINTYRIKRVAAACLVLWCAAACCEAAAAHDGAWWKSVSADEQTGFLAGYIDCAVYDQGRKQLAAASWDALAPQITKFYAAHADKAAEPVASLLTQFGSRQPAAATGGETYPEKHGIFDGEYWRQATPEHRLGYVSGYLECRDKAADDRMEFSHDAGWYAGEISKWYGVQPDDPGAIAEARAGRKIADVLGLLKSKRAAPAKNPKPAATPPAAR